MTYLQLMIQTLKFAINEKLGDDYYDYWDLSLNSECDWTKNYNKQLMYLILKNVNKDSKVNESLLLALEKGLTEYSISFNSLVEEIFDEMEETIDMLGELNEVDLESFLSAEQDFSSIEERHALVHEYVTSNSETVIIGKAMNVVYSYVMWLLPELYFTEKGYKYILDEYKITDETLRKRCYEYFRDSIMAYRCDRCDQYVSVKYKEKDFDGFLFDDDEEEYDDEEVYDDDEEEYDEDEYDDSYREEIIDEQYYGASGLYHAIKIMTTMLNFIAKKDFDKLESFIKLDEEIQAESEKMQSGEDKDTLVEIIYDTRYVQKLDLYSQIFTEIDNNMYLDYFLADEFLNSHLTKNEIARLIMYYFDPKDNKSINEINTNLNNLKMRKFPRPHSNSVSFLENYRWSKRYFDNIDFGNLKIDDRDYNLLDADIIGEKRNIRTVMFTDNDESYVPNSLKSKYCDYDICDCKENLNLTNIEEWEKFYKSDKPIVFINTSYMFYQFELANETKDKRDGVTQWAEFFFNNYKNRFWLKDKSKFIFVMTQENIEKYFEYPGIITDRIRPYYLQKTKIEKLEQNSNKTLKKTQNN